MLNATDKIIAELSECGHIVKNRPSGARNVSIQTLCKYLSQTYFGEGMKASSKII